MIGETLFTSGCDGFLVELTRLVCCYPRRALDLARFIVQTFLLHASLLRVGESGKLRLTNDTTALEFAVTQYLSAHGLALNSMGDQFKAVRGAMIRKALHR